MKNAVWYVCQDIVLIRAATSWYFQIFGGGQSDCHLFHVFEYFVGGNYPVASPNCASGLNHPPGVVSKSISILLLKVAGGVILLLLNWVKLWGRLDAFSNVLLYEGFSIFFLSLTT